MPLYDVRCPKDGVHEDVFAKMSEPPVCPECGGPVEIAWDYQKSPGQVNKSWDQKSGKHFGVAFDPSAAGRRRLAAEGNPKLAACLNSEGHPVYENDSHQKAVFREVRDTMKRNEAKEQEMFS